jgi:hypothetical protein
MRAAALTPMTKLVCLVLLDHMDNVGKVQYPVRDVATDLGYRNFRRVTDRITEAHRAGYLMTVTHAVHGRHAEYQATFPSDLQTGSLGDPDMGSLESVPSDLQTGSAENGVTRRESAQYGVTSITRTNPRGTVPNDPYRHVSAVPHSPTGADEDSDGWGAADARL